jgi:Kunitz/Bovine pancreatic trypsin inhibitor domain
MAACGIKHSQSAPLVLGTALILTLALTAAASATVQGTSAVRVAPNALEAGDATHPACALIPDPGSCHGFFRRFYYNDSTRRCEPFIYGGCAGGVPFRTAAQCEAACASPAVAADPASKELRARAFTGDPAYAVGDTGGDGRSGTRPVVFSAGTRVV